MTQPPANHISRRAVLRGIAIGATSPAWIRFAEPALASSSTAPTASRHLLVVFLRGGNDPLRTVTPVGYDALNKLRPNVGLREDDVFTMGNGFGVNRRLPSFFQAWQAGQLAVVQQAGFPRADFSHGSSARRWESGSHEDRFTTGWLGRYLDATPAAGPVRAVAFGDSMPLTLAGLDSDALSMRSLANFTFNDRKLRDATARHNALARMANSGAPKGSAMESLLRGQREVIGAANPLATLATSTINGEKPTNAQSAAQLFASGLGTEISFLSLSGYDTHTDERTRHNVVVGLLDEAISGFLQTAAAQGVAENSAVLVLSEFGRRVYETKSAGTDHGYGTSVFVLGPGVRGGMYGPNLDVAQLDDGNIPVHVDIRSVYAAVLGGWLRTNPAPILGADIAPLPLFR